MKLRNRTGKYDYDQTLVGRKKNFKVTIRCSAHPMDKERFWYYILDKDDYGYNSLWDGLKFNNQEQCIEAAENKIDELIKVK